MAEPAYTDQGAIFDGRRRYRYRLWRVWDEAKPRVAFLMLNPSTADEEVLDPTVRRCLGYAQAWGFGSFEVGNIFALRSTDPRALRAAADPVGRANDAKLISIAARSDLVVCGWGAHGGLQGRDRAVLELLEPVARSPRAAPDEGRGAGPPPLSTGRAAAGAVRCAEEAGRASLNNTSPLGHVARKTEGPEPRVSPETSGPSAEWALQVSNLRPQPCEGTAAAFRTVAPGRAIHTQPPGFAVGQACYGRAATERIRAKSPGRCHPWNGPGVTQLGPRSGWKPPPRP